MPCETKCGEDYESIVSSNKEACLVVEPKGMCGLIVANCLVSMQQSLPSMMAPSEGSSVSICTGRTRRRLEALDAIDR